MKNHYVILIIVSFLSCTVHAQTPNDIAFQIKEFSKEGLLLNRNWTFYPEDNFGYAQYDYKTKNGILVNPASLLNQLPVVESSGIGWFRLNLRVDSALRNKTIGMMLSLLGAAEIYLNGERIYQFGEVSANYKHEKTQVIYSRTLSITFGKQENQLLAVRYSHHPKNLYIKTGVIPPCLQIVLHPLNETIDRYAVLVRRAYLFIGIALTIELASALLTLFFFFSFRSRKEYLYFGLYFSLNFLGVFVQSDLAGVGKAVQISVNQFAFIQILIYLFLITGSLFHLNAMYALLNIKRTRYYKFLLGYAIVSMVALPFLPKWGGVLPDLFFVLACFEILPTYYKATRRKFSGAWILFISILICFLFLIALVTSNFKADSGAIIMLTAFTLLTPALGIVIFLAVDFARTSLALKSRVVQVEVLSKKTLAQERDKQEILAAQKDKLEKEVQHRTSELSKSLADLKDTQAQLIQSEKMASLGVLTAGIAHEIQNPLNFVNNFSDVSKELLDEMTEALQKGSNDEALTIANNIKENLHKITHHGKRADSIVKGMLQHSRKSTGIKELTDINALTEEYFRLSYYGLKAKNHDFSSSYVTHFDDSIEKIQVIPQDIGRVLMNLFNNAFYAVHEKKKVKNGSFEPMVTISTKRKNNQVEISVKDNGGGIPGNVIEKIFQPFFTTKPTGEGTGLGLSLSYDIIKAHGGEMKVNSKDGEGAEFTVLLPAE